MRTLDTHGAEPGIIDRYVLTLAGIGTHPDCPGAVAKDVFDLAQGESPHVLRSVAAGPGGHAQFHLVDPATARIRIRNVAVVQPRHLQAHHRAGDVVSAAGLDDHVLGDGHGPDRDAAAKCVSGIRYSPSRPG